VTDDEKVLARIKKVLGIAARRVGNDGKSNEFEAIASARRLYLILADRHLPLRFLVMPGAEVRLLPTQFLKHPQRKSLLRKVPVRRRNVFTEAHRLKDKDGQEAIERGFLAFDRYGYTVFVKLADVQVFF